MTAPKRETTLTYKGVPWHLHHYCTCANHARTLRDAETCQLIVKHRLRLYKASSGDWRILLPGYCVAEASTLHAAVRRAAKAAGGKTK